METEIYSELMIAFDSVKQKIKSLEKKKEELKTKLLIALKLDGLDDVETDLYSLKLASYKRKTFNKNLAVEYLENHGEDMSIYYQESDYEILKVKPKTKNTGEEQ